MRSVIFSILLLGTLHSQAATVDSLMTTPGKRKAVTPAPHEREHTEQSYFDKYVKPKSINALISYCDAQWMQEEKDSFAAMPEAVAIKHHHYWYDTWINKMWGILVNDSGVTANFKMYGIVYNEDKWLIILTSLHRQLNHKDIDLAIQVKELKNRRRKNSANSSKIIK